MLMTHLRHSTLPRETPTTPTPIVETTLQGGHSTTLRGTTTPSGPLFAILKGLVEAVLRSGGGLQRVRANLYAAILYFMQMAQKPQQTNDNRGKGVISFPSSLWLFTIVFNYWLILFFFCFVFFTNLLDKQIIVLSSSFTFSYQISIQLFSPHLFDLFLPFISLSFDFVSGSATWC